MKSFIAVLFTGWIAIACSALPELHPVDITYRTQLSCKCDSLFPTGKWQFVHSIETTMPGGQKGLVMGVIVISSQDKTVQCAIMTIEGIVIFDARYDRRLVIQRAVAPFDSEGFAEGLIRDIQLIFFRPEGLLIETGNDKDGASICRYRKPDGRIVDLVIHGDRSWQIRQYSRQLRLKRTVTAFFSKNNSAGGPAAIPDRLELTAHGAGSYNLMMDLVEAIRLGP
jgi:hypothetical protein